MKQRPGIFSILFNDSTAAPLLGSLTFLSVVTGIVYLTKALPGWPVDNANPQTFLWMIGILLPITVLVSTWRFRQVTSFFENGTEVNAQVLESRIFRTRWTLKLRYRHANQTHEITHIQLITGKTKALIPNKELVLVIDPGNPKLILLRDAYL